MAKCMSSAVKFTSWCVYLKENWDAGGKWSGCSRGHVDGFFVKITEHISFGWSRQFEALSHYSLSDARSLPSNSITIVSSLIDDRYLSLFELYFSHFSINRDWWRRKLSLSLSLALFQWRLTRFSLSRLQYVLFVSLLLWRILSFLSIYLRSRLEDWILLKAPPLLWSLGLLAIGGGNSFSHTSRLARFEDLCLTLFESHDLSLQSLGFVAHQR